MEPMRIERGIRAASIGGRSMRERHSLVFVVFSSQCNGVVLLLSSLRCFERALMGTTSVCCGTRSPADLVHACNEGLAPPPF